MKTAPPPHSSLVSIPIPLLPRGTWCLRGRWDHPLHLLLSRLCPAVILALSQVLGNAKAHQLWEAQTLPSAQNAFPSHPSVEPTSSALAFPITSLPWRSCTSHGWPGAYTQCLTADFLVPLRPADRLVSLSLNQGFLQTVSPLEAGTASALFMLLFPEPSRGLARRVHSTHSAATANSLWEFKLLAVCLFLQAPGDPRRVGVEVGWRGCSEAEDGRAASWEPALPA